MAPKQQRLGEIGLQVGARTSLQQQRKYYRTKRKQYKGEEEKESKKKKQPSRKAPSQTASSSASTNTANRQLVQQPCRTEISQTASSSASTTTALPSLRNIVHVWIDGSCLKVKRRRAGLGLHFPQSEYRDLSLKVFGAETRRALGPLRVPQRPAKRECGRRSRTTADFGFAARRDAAQTERARGPLGIAQCHSKRQQDPFASAVTHFGVPKMLSQCIQVMVAKGTSE